MNKITEKREGKQSGQTECFSAISIAQGALWGKQTQRSLKYFDIGKHTFDIDFIYVLVTIKRMCAQVNYEFDLLSKTQYEAVTYACNEVLKEEYRDQFPLHVWQTGSGTQTNMNTNEVIASLANAFLAQRQLDDDAKDHATIHPNDHVNMSQSSNDVFPSAMHIIVALKTHEDLLPAIENLQSELLAKQSIMADTYTVARTHLMDAIPVSADAALSAYQSQLTSTTHAIRESLNAIYQLALGGTAVGTGQNAPPKFGQHAIALLAEHYQLPFVQHPNLYAAVSGEDALLHFSNTLKQLAAVLFKIANDFRLLGSGPRCGFNEWQLPANEPGSSIMPGKVNPTQCEALSMVCLQIFGNDLTVSLAAANGQLQLNTYRPVIIHNVLESIDLLASAIRSFSDHTVRGLHLNLAQIQSNMHHNLSAITLLTPVLGYDLSADIVHFAHQKNVSLAEAAEALGHYQQAEFSKMLDEQMKLFHA